MLDATTDQLEGRTVVTADGDKIGKLDQLYVDSEDGSTPTFATVSAGMLGKKKHFVPLAEGSVQGEDVMVPYTMDQVKDAPGVEDDGALSTEEEDRLYAHYGLTGQGSGDVDQTADTGTVTETDVDRDRGTAGAQDVSGPNTDDAMTLSEEKLDVGVRRREAGKVRLRKYVVEENVTKTVPVRREEVRLEREPITDANRDSAYSGKDLKEEEVEITLNEEEVVVDKDVVATERVRLDKDVETVQQEVSDTVRREEVDVDKSGSANDTPGDRR